MRIVFTILGTLGDIRPHLALAADLQRRGHRPLFAVPCELLPYARAANFEAVQLGPDLREQFTRMLRLTSHSQATKHDIDVYNDALLSAAPIALQELLAHCNEADLLISSHGMPLGRIVHELCGIPFVSIRACLPDANSSTSRAEAAADDPINAFRVMLGLSPLADLETRGYSPQLHLFAQSPVVYPPDTTWPAHYHVTGYLFLDESEWQPDPMLESFLQNGPSPVVFNLGSVVRTDPEETTALFLEAAQLSGQRAVILEGWSGLAQGIQLSDSVFAADFVPHSWLFPQAACIVHHGGAGTTAAALRAGVPSVMLPHVFDQSVQAQRTLELGCTGAILSPEQINASQLGAAISSTLANAYCREMAARVGEQIRSERGVEVARALIEEFSDQRPRQASA